MSHSRLSPSGAHRYSRCYGAPNAEHGIVDDGSIFAAEGTMLHDVAAMCLEYGVGPEVFVGKTFTTAGHSMVMPEDIVRWISPGLERIRQLAEGNLLVIESRVTLDHVLGAGEGGTVDVGIIDLRNQELTAFDWKFGQGVPVEVSFYSSEGELEPNEQAALYASGLLNRYFPFDNTDKWKIRLIIEQPRVPSGGGEFLMSIDQMFKFEARMAKIADFTRFPSAPRTAGEKQCKFCKAKSLSHGGCDTYTAFALDLVNQKIDSLDEFDLPEIGSMTLERMAYIDLHSDMLTNFLSDIHEHLLRRAKIGETIPGMKLVAGRLPARKYVAKTEKEVQEILEAEIGEKAWDRSLISPTQAEKVLSTEGYAALSKFIDRGKPKPALVSSSSKGEPIQSYLDKLD